MTGRYAVLLGDGSLTKAADRVAAEAMAVRWGAHGRLVELVPVEPGYGAQPYESASKVVRLPEFRAWLERNRPRLTPTVTALAGTPATVYTDTVGRVAAIAVPSAPGVPGIYHIYAGEVVD